jgi:hypothetical protein
MTKLINHSGDAPAHIIETFDDLAAALGQITSRRPVIWSPPDAASTHGVLWFAELQRQATAAFPDRQPLIALDCGERADLAHAAMCEGLRIVCFRGPSDMRAKLESIAAQLGARIEPAYPAAPVRKAGSIT